MSAVVVLSLLGESLFHKTVHAAVCHLGSMSAAGGCSSRAAGSFRGCCPNSEGGLAACTGGATAHELRVAGRSCSCIRCVPALTALSNHTIDCADHAISSGNVEWHVCMHACLRVQHALTARQTLLSRLCRPLYKVDPGVPDKAAARNPPTLQWMQDHVKDHPGLSTLQSSQQCTATKGAAADRSGLATLQAAQEHAEDQDRRSQALQQYLHETVAELEANRAEQEAMSLKASLQVVGRVPWEACRSSPMSQFCPLTSKAGTPNWQAAPCC